MTETLTHQTNVNFSPDRQGQAGMSYSKAVAKRGYNSFNYNEFEVDKFVLLEYYRDNEEHRLMDFVANGVIEKVLVFDDVVALICGRHVSENIWNVSVYSAAANSIDIEKFLLHLSDVLPAVSRNVDGRCPVVFWNYGPHGGQRTTRSISTPSWDDMKENYNDSLQKQLGKLVDANSDENFSPEGGQLILWHGDPGTGKTYALRALIDKWKEWCEIVYIIDPETFFGSQVDYLMDVLLSADDDFGYPSPNPLPERDEDKWKLIILEDTGELLRKDAKEKVGQGLSRLLNVVDGFIGQGLKVLILVTTNEELGRLNEAVVRPGRCLSVVKFNRLTLDEANKWREARGLEKGGAASIAELYAEFRGEENEDEEKITPTFGFTTS